MRKVLWLTIALAVAVPAAGQDVPNVVLQSDDTVDFLKLWRPYEERELKILKDYVTLVRAWKQWTHDGDLRQVVATTWGWFEPRMVKRMFAPYEPVWLPGYCAVVKQPENLPSLFREACELYEFVDKYHRMLPFEAPAQKAVVYEAMDMGRLWRYIHIDSPAVAMDWRNGLFTMIGTHLTVFNIGRIHFYGPPGISVACIPTSRGRRCTPIYTWGADVRLRDFDVPLFTNDVTLYLHIAKAYIASRDARPSNRSEFDIIGFSFTRKW